MAQTKLVVKAIWLIPPPTAEERGVLRFEEESGLMTDYAVTLDHAQALAALAQAALSSWPTAGRS